MPKIGQKSKTQGTPRGFSTCLRGLELWVCPLCGAEHYGFVKTYGMCRNDKCSDYNPRNFGLRLHAKANKKKKAKRR